MKRSMLLTLGALLVVALLATACGLPPTDVPRATAAPSTALPTDGPPTAQPAGETPTGDLVYGKANVEAIDIRILELFPVQVQVVARGYLPDGCTEIDAVHQERTGQTFQVTVTTVRPADAMCIQVVEPFEETVALDVYGLAAGRYTVDVNGVAGAFELAVDNAPPTEPEGDDTVEPPPAFLTIAGQEQVSGIGTYCWGEPSGTAPGVHLCIDLMGIPTAEEPLLATSPFTATFRLAPEGPPEELLVTVISVTPSDEMNDWPAGQRGWPFLPGERYTLPLENEPSLALSLEPGLYVLNLFGRWEGRGDASYGFLIQVQGLAPALTIDEWPVVAADVDTPSHFEYLDRLGEAQLARLKGLRERAVERRLAEANEALAPFGYRLEARFDAEWNTTFYDLYKDGFAEPLAPGLSRFWPVSVNASGTDFVMVAENAPNIFPLYLQVNAAGVTEWDPATSVWLAPVYVGDRLATIATTGDVTMTYQVLLDQQAVYTGTALFLVDNPFRTLTYCGGRWVLEVDDHLIVDGQDLGQVTGYESIFGFTELHGQPFYFFEKDGQVRISYAGKTLPNVYDEVVHNQCCEPAMFNVETHPDVVVFHARWQGTWYLVEAGIFEGEMASTWRYGAPEGWSFRYPSHWDVLDGENGFVQESATGKTVTFGSAPSTEAELEEWIEAEIARKLAATEAENTLAEPLSVSREGELAVYRYAIRSRMEGADTLLRTTLFFDGQRRYEFGATIPPMSEEEYRAIVVSFRPAP